MLGRKITPSNFNGDPLGWAGNQLGHFCLGILACYWFSWVWKAVSGELPYALVAVAVWAVVYLLIELPQGGGLWDTLEDIVWSVAMPASIALWSRDVFVASPNAFDAIAPIMATATVLLAVGSGIRFAQMVRGDK